MWVLTSGKLEILGNSDRYYVFVLGRKKVSLLVVFWIVCILVFFFPVYFITGISRLNMKLTRFYKTFVEKYFFESKLSFWTKCINTRLKFLIKL